MAFRDSCEDLSKICSAGHPNCACDIDSDDSDNLPELIPDMPTETMPETSARPQRLASRLSFWSMLKKHKKKNRSSRDVAMQDSSSSPAESSDEGSADAVGSRGGGFWSVVKKHLMKSPEPESDTSRVEHDPIPSVSDPEPLLGATALPLDSSSNSSYEADPISNRLEEEAEIMEDFESENVTPQPERRRLSPNASFAEQIQFGLDLAQEFMTPITPPRQRSGPFGFPFGPPLDSFSSSFGGRPTREFGTAFGTGAHPSPLDILSQVLRGHLDNASQSETRNREPEIPDLDSPPLSTSPESIPELIPNLQPGESDSSSDESDTYVPMPPLGDPQELPDEPPINPPELGRSNTESSMAVPLLPGLIYIVVSVDDASLAGLHLLSQLDNSGPAPLSETRIDQIPTKLITKEQCDTGLQCSICMEDFCIQQSVRVLCCDHCFHNGCIRPWLELHGTCPVCRKTLTNPEDEANSELQNSSNNILNGASGLAARLSGAVSVSSSSASSSSSLSTASSDGTRQRPTITMFII